MKKIIILITILLSVVSSASEVKKDKITQEEKKVFAEFYRSFFSLRKEFPDKLDVNVIFVDVNRDKKLDALAVSKGGKYQDGWDWCVFSQDENTGWKPIRGMNEMTGKPVKLAQIFARPDAFYRIKKEGKPSQIIILNKVYAKGLEPDVTALRIIINKKVYSILRKFRFQTNKSSRNTNTLNMKPSKSN